MPNLAQATAESRSRTTVHHALTPEDQTVMATMRLHMPPTKINFGPDIRALFDEMMEHTPDAPGVSYEQAEVGGVPGWWARPEGALQNAVILYLHGGAYIIGSARSDRHLAGQLAARAGVAAFLPEYRLAPEQVFPAAVNDALVVYRGLAAQGYTSVALAGDSAGGGLALVTLAQAVAESRVGAFPAPRGAAVMSPWVDLTLSGQSMISRADADPLLSGVTLGHAAAQYLAGHDSSDPLASPLLGDLTGFPPVQLHVGGDEVLMDDAVRYADRLTAAGGSAQANVWAGMIHVFPSSVGTLTASTGALDDMGRFLYRQLR